MRKPLLVSTSVTILLLVILAATVVPVHSKQQTRGDDPPTPGITVSAPTLHTFSFNYSGTSVRFIGYEEFPLTVASTSVETASVRAEGVPMGVFAFLKSDQVQASASGSADELYVIGAVRPLSGSGDFDLILTSQMAGMSYQTSLPLAQIGIQESLVLNASSNLLPSSIEVSAGAAGPYVFGMVYSPSATANSGTQTAQEAEFSILGVYANDSVTTLPSWLSVSLSSHSCSLTPYIPCYVALDEDNSASLPPYVSGEASLQTQNLTLAVSESVNGVSHNQLVTLMILPSIQT